MKIAISEIKVSSNPIRTEQDEEKLNELAQSIKEQGLIVPIKVRPNGNGYEVVYGHRRLEACKRTGLGEIEAIVEGVDDKDQLIQALIENVVREDMNPIDTAKGIKSLQDKSGWSLREIERRGIIKHERASRLLALLNEDEEIQDLISGKSNNGDKGTTKLSERHIRQVRVSGVKKEEHKPILIKAADEGLTYSQTAKVAGAIAQAKTPEERQAILNTPIENPMFDRIVRAKARAKREIKEEIKDKHFEKTQEVKEFLDALFVFEKAIREADEAIDFDKFSPEAKQFSIHRLDKLSGHISELVIRLMEV